MCPSSSTADAGPSAAQLRGEIQRLRAASADVSQALRSVEALTRVRMDPASSPAELCQVIAGNIRDAADVKRMGVFLMDPASLNLEVALSVPESAETRVRAEFEEQLHAGAVGMALRDHRMVCSAALTPDSGTDGGRNAILLPICTPAQVWGLAICFTPQHPDEVAQNMARLLTIIANYAGAMIENASLMKRLSEQNRDLERIVEERNVELLARKRELERANAELRQADAAKDDYTSLVAHELRTPLTGILSLSEFLSEGGLTEQEVREFGVSIRAEAERLHRLVSDVLDMARMEAGKLEYQSALRNLNDTATSCARNMKAAAHGRGIRLRMELDPDLPCVPFDADRVQQVVLNLLSNAIKFSPDGAEVVLSTRTDDHGVRLTVQDFGEGIAARDIPKVFNKFERVRHLKCQREGTGFGMPIAKNIIEAGHGGRLWVESEGRGKGATFYFTLPRAGDRHFREKPS